MSEPIFSSADLASARADMDALFSYQKPRRVPNGAMCFGQDFAIRNTGQDVADLFHDPAAFHEAVCWTAKQYQWHPFLPCSSFSVLGCLDFGGTMTYPTRNGEYFVPAGHPVADEGDVAKLSLPDPKTTGDIPRQLAFGRLQQAAGLPVPFMARSPFGMAPDMCGLTRFMTWLIQKPELCERMMEIAYRHTLQVLDVWVETFGVENLQVWMTTPIESNQLISPKHMETFAMPYYIKYGEHLKTIGIRQFAIHLCGEQNPNLPVLAEADPWPHPAILSFGAEVEIERAAQLFPQDIIFGNIETVLLEKGRPGQVFDACQNLLEKGKRIEGGFILAPSCDTPVFSPPVNIYAMTRAVAEYGAY